MMFFVCALAGMIGASMAAGILPGQSIHGVPNLALGALGGTVAFAATVELLLLEPGVSVFLQFLVIGGISGALMTLAIGSLRNILRNGH
ncbi:hypothetical protein GE300_01405 [Rhodobacteraceae bacterium 2CG4]|uniref:Uncharacterized protein n=1 Tax=Halovulum marinum TaxID=2662447 RepID=A0A6L5YVF0_9RHOB|nr:hypothetical protein [Halovulum marinum]MSU88271.1 hypothetical protein [Halovulum marinum]